MPVPTRVPSVRLTTTYAGYSGESTLPDRLYKRGLRGAEIAPDLRAQSGMLMYWTLAAAWKPERLQQLQPSLFKVKPFGQKT